MESKKKKSAVIPIVVASETEKIWLEFSEQLKGFIQKRISNEADVKDILQEVFFKIHLKKHTLREDSKLVSWIYQLTRNAVADFYRKKSRQTDVWVEMPVLIDIQADRELSACIIPFIGRLTERDKELVRLVYLEGASQKELAQNLGMPYSTIKSRLQRARQKMKVMFMNCCPIELDKKGRVVDFTCDDCE